MKKSGARTKKRDLQRDDGFYRTTLDSLSEGCQIINRKWEYVYLNEVAAKHGRRSREELLGRTIMDAYPGVESTELFTRLRECLEKGIRSRMENEFAYPDGTRAWFEVRMEPVPEGVFVFSVDITGEKQTILELEKRRKYLETLVRQRSIELEAVRKLSTAVEQTADNIVITDRNGVIEYVNPAFERLTGFTSEEVIGKNPRVVKSGKLGDDFYKGLWDTILAGQTFREVFINRKKNGELFFEEQTITPILDESGGITHFVSAGKDITGRIKAEEELKLTYEKLRHLLEHSPAVMYTLSLERGLVTPMVVSDNIERLLGVTAKESARYDWWLASLHPEERERVVAATNKGFEGEGYAMEYRIRHKDGSYRWIEDNNRVVRDEVGRPLHAVGVWTDITYRKRAEEVLQASERRLREMLENLSLIAITLNTEGRVSFCNDYLLNLTGWKREDCIGSDWFDRFIPKDSNAGKVFYDSLTAATIPAHFENPIVTRAGERREIRWNNTLLRDSDGTIIGTASIGEDITEAKLAQDALRNSESELRALFGAMTDVVMVLDDQGRYVRIAPTDPRNLYRPPKEIIGKKIHDVMDKETADLILGKIRECLNLSQTVSYEYCLDIGERKVWFEGRISPLSETTVFWIAQDITKRREAEARNLEQTQLLELATDAIIVRDLDDHVIFWNNGSEKLYGWKKGEVAGRRITDFLFKSTEAFDKAKEATIAAGSWVGELRQQTKGGNEVIVSSRWTLVRSESGEPTSILVINTDITSKKLMEQQFLRSQRLESIGTLAGGIAHDLNNALGPILLGAQVIEKKITDETARKMLKNIEKSAQRGADMVKQILAFARGLAGEFGIVRPKNVIEEVHKIVAETFPKNIDIEVDIQKGLGSISGDATQLHQLLMNLCVNARDAMPNGGTLTMGAENFAVDNYYVNMHQGLKPGPHILLKITDTGSGMPKGVLDKIFDPFYTTKEPGKGTGLGLSTVAMIAKAHGGTVDVYSEVNRGTTFKVLLPALLEAGREPVKKLEDYAVRGQGELLLVVDDEVTLREMTKQTLEMFGYEVITAADGTEAVTQFIGARPRVKLVLTDMAMPIMDGEATIRALRKIDPTIRIIATSGQHDAISDAKAQRMEINRPLAKPFTAEQLLRAVGEVLAGGERKVKE